jgi:hypothetical protein
MFIHSQALSCASSVAKGHHDLAAQGRGKMSSRTRMPLGNYSEQTIPMVMLCAVKVVE